MGTGRDGTLQLTDNTDPSFADAGKGRLFWDDTINSIKLINEAGNIVNFSSPSFGSEVGEIPAIEGYNSDGSYELRGGNLDTPVTNSTYNIDATVITNGPIDFTAGFGFLTTYIKSTGASNATQILVGMGPENANKIWMRHKETGVWTTWALIASGPQVRYSTGTYTGDGTTSQAITGIGFLPRSLWVTNVETVNGAKVNIFQTNTDVMGGNVAGGVVVIDTGRFETDRIISLDADGFTVDANGMDSDPNTNGQLYTYRALG